jgi:hypothetical protein
VFAKTGFGNWENTSRPPPSCPHEYERDSPRTSSLNAPVTRVRHMEGSLGQGGGVTARFIPNSLPYGTVPSGRQRNLQVMGIPKCCPSPHTATCSSPSQFSTQRSSCLTRARELDGLLLPSLQQNRLSVSGTPLDRRSSSLLPSLSAALLPRMRLSQRSRGVHTCDVRKRLGVRETWSHSHDPLAPHHLKGCSGYACQRPSGYFTSIGSKR